MPGVAEAQEAVLQHAASWRHGVLRGAPKGPRAVPIVRGLSCAVACCVCHHRPPPPPPLVHVVLLTLSHRDATHTVAVTEVERHVLVCPRLKVIATQESLPCFRKGANVGSCSEDDAAAIAAMMNADVPGVAQPSTLQRALAGVDVDAFCDRLLALAAAVPAPRVAVDTAAPCCAAYLAAVPQPPNRHVQQQVSMLSTLNGHGLLKSSFRWIEFGCGRGLLSLALAHTVDECTVVLLDRDRSRKQVRVLRSLPLVSGV